MVSDTGNCEARDSHGSVTVRPGGIPFLHGHLTGSPPRPPTPADLLAQGSNSGITDLMKGDSIYPNLFKQRCGGLRSEVQPALTGKESRKK